MLENSSIHSHKQLNIRVYQSIVLEMRDCIVTLKRQNLATFASGKLVKEENYEKDCYVIKSHAFYGSMRKRK